MVPQFKAAGSQSLLHGITGGNKGTLPGKSISWKWDPNITEREATEAIIMYARKPAGRIYLDSHGEFQASMEIEVEGLDGQMHLISAQTYEGFESIKMAGSQIYYKFRRAASQAGFHWPW